MSSLSASMLTIVSVKSDCFSSALSARAGGGALGGDAFIVSGAAGGGIIFV